MLITCPSCGGAFEIARESLGVKATVVCRLCRRVVVVRDAHLVPPGEKEGTVPFDPGTEAAVEPVDPADEPTDVSEPLPRGIRISLAILSGRRAGEAVPVERPIFVIGRAGGDADLQIADMAMSRRHAALECQGGRVLLRDLGSRNGSFVGEERVQARHVHDRTEIRLGETRLMIVVSGGGGRLLDIAPSRDGSR